MVNSPLVRPRAGLQRQNDGGDVGPLRGISRAERHDVPGRRSQRGQVRTVAGDERRSADGVIGSALPAEIVVRPNVEIPVHTFVRNVHEEETKIKT